MTLTAIELVERYLVSPKWVAEYYGVPLQRVYYAIRKGHIPATKIPGGGVVIDRQQLPESI